MPALRWSNVDEIGYQLSEKFPETDPLAVRFTDLHQRVMELEEFSDDPGGSSEKVLEVKGHGAVVIQHECDHLDGVLYVDRVDTRTLAFLGEYKRFGQLHRYEALLAGEALQLDAFLDAQAAGIGVVVEGRMNGDVFETDRVMVKHSNEYEPPHGEKPEQMYESLIKTDG